MSGHPVPVPDADTAPFWEGTARHRLLVPRCGACSHWVWQPKPLCPRCHTAGPVWTEVSGEATVASWTVVHPPVLPVYADDVPFVVLLVELADAPPVRMVGRLDGPDDGLAMGAPLSLRWHDQGDWVVPAWALSTPGG